MEVFSTMLMGDLLEALRERLRRSIRNGQLTERGLARKAGLSQAHVHNVLKGARGMTTPVADQILSCLGMTVADLMEPDGARKGPGTADAGPQDRATSR